MDRAKVGGVGVGGVGVGGVGVGCVAVVLVRPWLWPTAARQALALAGRGWWRRPPFLPRPEPAYLAFRMETMYGDRSRNPAPDDVLAYLEWCRMHRRGLR